MRYNNVELNRLEAIVEAFSNYFKSAFLQPNGDSYAVNGRNHSNMPIISVAALSEDEIVLSMRRLKNKMTCGPDNIPRFLVKDCAHV